MMAVSSYCLCRSDPGLSRPYTWFPRNIQRHLSIRACPNIRAASWSDTNPYADDDVRVPVNPSGKAPSSPADSGASSAAMKPLYVERAAGDDVRVPVNPLAGSPAEPSSVELGAYDDVRVPVSKGDTAGNGTAVFKGSADSSYSSSFLKTDGSKAVHAGERLGRGIVSDAITTPVVSSSAYYFEKTADLKDKEKRRSNFGGYARYGNPTTEVLEKKINALEGAESTLITASGMCVITSLLNALVRPGGHLVITTNLYRNTRKFIETELPTKGIRFSAIDPSDVEALKSALEQNNVSLFFAESPSNPLLRCVDIKLVSEVCHSKGALVCIDGTFATPLNQKALALGADLVVHSATKYIGGHNDVLGGCISGPLKLVSKVRALHSVSGGTLSPYDAYLLIRSMKTLHLRVRQQNSTALRMAKILEEHPKVMRVYYPGLPSHPEHELAKSQMTGYGGVVSFEIHGDLRTTSKFVDSLKIPCIAPSFGGCESIVNQPALMSYGGLPQSERAKYGIHDNLVRFSFGVENFEDLKADVLHALEAI